jgi:hypothetical protein
MIDNYKLCVKTEGIIIIDILMSWQKPDDTYQELYETEKRHELQKYPIIDTYGFVYRLEDGKIIKRTDEERKEEYIAFKINELDNKCEQTIYQKVCDKKRQIGFVARYTELSENKYKRETVLTSEEEIEYQSLRKMHSAFKNYKAQFHEAIKELNNLKTNEILNYKKEYKYIED